MLYAHMMRVSETWLSNLKIKARTSAHRHVWGGGIAAVPAPLPTRGVALLGKEGGLTSLSSSSRNDKGGEGGAGGKWRQCAGAIIFNRCPYEYMDAQVYVIETHIYGCICFDRGTYICRYTKV